MWATCVPWKLMLILYCLYYLNSMSLNATWQIWLNKTTGMSLSLPLDSQGTKNTWTRSENKFFAHLTLYLVTEHFNQQLVFQSAISENYMESFRTVKIGLKKYEIMLHHHVTLFLTIFKSWYSKIIIINVRKTYLPWWQVTWNFYLPTSPLSVGNGPSYAYNMSSTSSRTALSSRSYIVIDWKVFYMSLSSY